MFVNCMLLYPNYLKPSTFKIQLNAIYRCLRSLSACLCPYLKLRSCLSLELGEKQLNMENTGPDYDDTVVNGSSVSELLESLPECFRLLGCLL